MNEIDEHVPRPRVSSALSGIGLLAGLALLAVAVVWVLNISRLAALPDTPPVLAPAAGVEVTGVVTGESDAGEPSTSPQTGAAAGLAVRVDPAWSARVSAATGIPQRALDAYALADLVIDAEQPGCGLGWNTLAGIGAIETDHGRHGGALLGADGYPSPAIRGPQLDGNGNAAIGDTDGGAWDGDTVWDRAVGPMQFIPDTWSRWGADGNHDGAIDPNQIDDATLAAARYLCHSGAMSSTEGWRAAIFSYNHLDSYVNDVAAVANRYAENAG